MVHVAIVEDVRDIREGLTMLIDASPAFCCSHAFATAEEAIGALPSVQPDVVLMDIQLPGLNGIEAVQKLKPLCPDTQFIMSTVYEDDEKIFQSLAAGANGYLLKKTPPEKILEAITEVYNGGSPMNGQIARRVISFFQQTHSIADNGLLTEREKEILQELAKGYRYKEIAHLFKISIETVRSHARKIYEKLQVRSRTEALNKIYGNH